MFYQMLCFYRPINVVAAANKESAKGTPLEAFGQREWF